MNELEKTYFENIEKLLAEYQASTLNHISDVHRMMKTESIPIYIRWTELLATIRAFEELAKHTEKTLRFLDMTHNAKEAQNN